MGIYYKTEGTAGKGIKGEVTEPGPDGCQAILDSASFLNSIPIISLIAILFSAFIALWTAAQEQRFPDIPK